MIIWRFEVRKTIDLNVVWPFEFKVLIISSSTYRHSSFRYFLASDRAEFLLADRRQKSKAREVAKCSEDFEGSKVWELLFLRKSLVGSMVR